MSAPFLSRSKVCSNTTIARLRTLRQIPKAEAAVSYSAEYAEEATVVVPSSAAVRAAVPYTGPTGVETTSVLYDAADATGLPVESAEIEVPDTMVGQIDLWLDLRMRWATTGAANPAATDYPSSQLGSPFIIRVRRVEVSTAGAITVDATFNNNLGKVEMLVPRTFWDPDLTRNTAAFFTQNYISNSVLHIRQDDGTLLDPGRYVIDLLLVQDAEFWAQQAISATDGMQQFMYTAPTGFDYDGIQVNDFLVKPAVMYVKPTLLYGSAMKAQPTSAPVDTAPQTYLCTSGACTVSTVASATALDTCLETCT